jgi:uncharacterized protein YjbI with pentapeptide repeats
VSQRPTPLLIRESSPAAWGEYIDDRRARELLARIAAWRSTHERAESPNPDHFGPFKGVKLTGADVFFLVAQILAPEYPASAARLLLAAREGLLAERDPRLTLHLSGLRLEGADLAGAVLAGALLNGIQLQHAVLQGADLSGASCALAHLDGADLRGATLDNADLHGAVLTGATLTAAHAEGAVFCGARLERARLAGAYLAGADLRETHLAGANMLQATLAGADLRGATCDATTGFENVRFADARHGAAALGDMVWDGARLTRTNWALLRRLGDERFAPRHSGAEAYAAIIRAYRQLAAVLYAQGLHEDAIRYAYRARIWQRRLCLRRLHVVRYLGAWLLALFAGYGYRPGRAVLWYTAIAGGFALLYWQLPHLLGVGLAPLSWHQAVMQSLADSQGIAFYQLTSQGGAGVTPPMLAEGALGVLDEIVLLVALVLRRAARP